MCWSPFYTHPFMQESEGWEYDAMKLILGYFVGGAESYKSSAVELATWFSSFKKKRMHHLILLNFVLLTAHGVQSLPYDPDDYLEVYPDPRDPEVLKGRTPLYFALIMSLGGEHSLFDGSGSVAGVKLALDSINNSSLLPGYTLHYTLANSQVWVDLPAMLNFS